MKTLKVYAKDSFELYPNIGRDHLFSVGKENGVLTVLRRDTTTGEESSHAAFHNWDYYLLEE